MNRNEIISEFNALIDEVCALPSGLITLSGTLSLIAKEQIRAGFSQEATSTMDHAVQAMENEQKELAMLGYGAGLRLDDLLNGTDSHRIERENWKLSVLSEGYAMAGKVSEAREFASLISTDEKRQRAMERISEITDPKHKDSMKEAGSRLASLLRNAAELAEQGRPEAVTIVREAYKISESLHEKSLVPSNRYSMRARELADLALKLKARDGGNLPVNFIKGQKGAQTGDTGTGRIKR